MINYCTVIQLYSYTVIQLYSYDMTFCFAGFDKAYLFE